jgi:ABC-type branched-subunit amino acid transport system ATPase component
MSGSAETPGAAKTDPVLIVNELRRSFGGVVSVDVPHLEVQKGIVTSIIGPNGAGKTTLSTCSPASTDLTMGITSWTVKTSRTGDRTGSLDLVLFGPFS